MTETPENPQPAPTPASDSSGSSAPDAGDHAFSPVTSSDAIGPSASPAPVQPPFVAPGVAPAPQPYPQGPPPYAGAAVYPGAAQDPNLPGGVPPYGGYPGAVPAPKKPLSKGALFGIIGGAVAVVLIIAAAIIVPAALRPPAVTASDVVESYLTALSDGDAEAALEYVDPYGEEALLTDDVLAASLERGAIDDIEVAEVAEDEEYEATVPVTFTIGGEPISRDFQVYSYGEGDWQIADGLIALSGFYGFEGLGLTVNGVEAPETAYVFPGTYELAVGVEQFTIEGDTTTFVVASDADAEVLWDLRPALTEEGAAQFRTLVRASVEECIAMRTLTTPCGMDLTDIDLDGHAPVEGTVTRTLTAEGQSTLDALTPEVSSGSIVTSYDTIDVDMTLQGDQGGTIAEFEVWFGGYLDSPLVDFAVDSPTVVWE